MSILIQDSENQSVKDGMVTLTDLNGKSIQVKLDDVSDASTYNDNNIEVVYDRSQANTKIVTVITDSDDKQMQEQELIDDIKSGKITSLDVCFEATHSGRNLNNAVYVSESMAEDCHTFMYPYAKPLIKNHDSYEEPLGRVVDSEFAPSEFISDRDTINVTFRVSDQDAMQKFADGRYRTMSISASAKHIKCNTCGKDILKDNNFKFCGHWRGEYYAGQICTWTTTQLDYKEGSVVNQPADVYAQVKRIKVNKTKGVKDMNEDENKDLGILDDIDNLTNKDGEGTHPKATPETDPKATQDNERNGTGEGEGTEVKDAEIARLTAELKTVKDENETLKTTHATEIAAKDAEIATLTEAQAVTDAELVAKKDQAVKLATMNKQLLADSVKAYNAEIKDEDLACKSAKDLYKMLSDAKAAPRVPGQVKNPGIVLTDNNTLNDNEDVNNDNGAENKSATKKTMKDMEAVVANFFK